MTAGCAFGPSALMTMWDGIRRVQGFLSLSHVVLDPSSRLLVTCEELESSLVMRLYEIPRAEVPVLVYHWLEDGSLKGMV
jgi:hypothetical protein